MELKDYKDMYQKMDMSEEMDERLKNKIKGNQINMRKLNIKKTATAAALVCLAVAGGASAYATTGHSSLMSLFVSDSSDVQSQAARLLEKDIVQEKGDNTKQSDLATFRIREAICDNNRVFVQVAVKAVDAEKYLLIPQDCMPEEDPVFNLGMKGVDVDKHMSVKEYAESIGKKCLCVSASVDCKAGSQSIDNSMEEDGTLVYTISFQNEEKSKKLNYTCNTCVRPVEGEGSEDSLKDKIKFTLTDKSDVKKIKYLPASKKKVAGTNLVVDEVVFEKSDLEMACYVKYHYVGGRKEWINTTDGDICFFMLDENGKIIESKSGEGTDLKGCSATQLDNYSLQDLPDTISFVAKDVFEKDIYGTVDVRLEQ